VSISVGRLFEPSTNALNELITMQEDARSLRLSTASPDNHVDVKRSG